MEASGMLWWLGQHLLITSVLAGAVFVICRGLRLSPAASHLMWGVVLCRFLIPPVATWPWTIPVDGLMQVADRDDSQSAERNGGADETGFSPELMVLADVEIDTQSTHPTQAPVASDGGEVATRSMVPAIPEIKWHWLIAGVWGTGSIVLAVWLAHRALRVTRVLKSDAQTSSWLDEDMARWCERLEIREPARIVTPHFRSPFLWCLGRVRLVWPLALNILDQREAARPVLIHELAHLKRRDHWMAWLELIALVAWWWNPVFWFVRRQVRMSAEMACDAWVIELLPADRRTYAESLLEFSRQTETLQLAVGAVGADPGSRRTFERRLEMIMKAEFPVRFSKRVLAMGLLIGLVSLPAFSTDTNEPGAEATEQEQGTATVTTTRDVEVEVTESSTSESQKVLTQTRVVTVDSDGTLRVGPASSLDETANDESSASLDEVLKRIESSYFNQIDRRELEQAAIAAIITKLDEYSKVLDPDEFRQMKVLTGGDLAGVGIALRLDDDTNELIVQMPILRSPAQTAGIRKDDVIVSIDDVPTLGQTLKQMVARIRGPRGSIVALRIRRDGKEQNYKVKRDNFAVQRIEPWSVSEKGKENFWVNRAERIGYVRVPLFTKKTGTQLKEVVADLSDDGLRSLVIDLRDCPGGVLSAAAEVADLFVEEGIIVSSRGRGRAETLTIRAKSDGTNRDVRLALLVNENTASAAEIVTACLQDHHRATIIGGQTFGRGTVQSLFPLNDGGALKLTTAAWLRPNGKTLLRREGRNDWGVLPDAGFAVKVSDDEQVKIDESRTERLNGENVDVSADASLNRAVDFLKQS